MTDIHGNLLWTANAPPWVV
ncbi:hypothetical protein [Streptococcus infantis]